MRNKGYCVFDTNTLVSALILRSSVSRKAFDKVLDEYRLLLSEDTAFELYDVLGRDKFRKYISYDELEPYYDLLHREARFIKVQEHVSACRDPKDNKFLSLAVTASAIAIITGDKDLLVLDPFENISIVNPADFLKNF